MLTDIIIADIIIIAFNNTGNPMGKRDSLLEKPLRSFGKPNSQYEEEQRQSLASVELPYKSDHPLNYNNKPLAYAGKF